MRKFVILAAALLFCTQAQAQWTDVTLVNPIGYSAFPLDGLPVSSINPNVLASGCNADQSECGVFGINIQNFAQASTVAAQGAQISSLTSEFAHLQSDLSSFSTAFSSRLQQANQLAVIAGAMKDAIPNDGDRFALRINMAADDGIAAGSISFSANVTNSLRLSVDYGRSQNQNMFSGGLNMSFH
jgi:hypothetical protein